MNNQDGQSIKDITATLRGGQPQPSLTGASSKTRHSGPQNLSSTQPALTQSSAKAGQAVKDCILVILMNFFFVVVVVKNFRNISTCLKKISERAQETR